jgi:hypothetical protein
VNLFSVFSSKRKPVMQKKPGQPLKSEKPSEIQRDDRRSGMLQDGTMPEEIAMYEDVKKRKTVRGEGQG